MTEIGIAVRELAPHGADALELCLRFGSRKREAPTLEVADVNLEEGGVRLRGERTKGPLDSFLPAIPAGLELRLLVARAERDEQTYLVLFRRPQRTRSAPDRNYPRKQDACGQ